ncbi:unnamed protein product [Arctia plantaginis]|uniref:Enoyl-[acyl-carrier-protein] reductase, mitochondrial n=1 Tax=Arctia plantaginis TaxID=874455 RepID=A0A8S0ZL86_ARCPL|nr:unnamed protein product [Arctia plantaginis]CAB3253318.1 unnamed protein product [Arctia plantaginis]
MANLTAIELVYEKFGNPTDVIHMKERKVPELGKDDVMVRMLAAPINPADINTIQGKYPVKINLPSIPGNEGVGLVEKVGKDVQKLSPGQKVIIIKPGQGTWRNLAVFNKDVLKLVPDQLGLAEAATLTVNPCTAYRMLSDFKPVREKCQVVIQNGANSACGQCVIQLCKTWNIPNVNIVRDRPEINALKDFLINLGATHVLTEKELKSTDIFKNKVINKPVLALNCVGGMNARQMIKHLNHSASMITFGGMSKKPVTIPTPAFIFKNLSFFGFWMTAWQEKATKRDKDKMWLEIINYMCEKKLHASANKLVKFDSYKEALSNSLTSQGFTGCKYILDFGSKN